MADKEQAKPTEQDPKSIDAPAIQVLDEGASGGKKGVLKSFADKMKHIGQVKRRKSRSPESHKGESHMEDESSKDASKQPGPSSSKRGFTDKVKHLLLHPTGVTEGDDEEMENLCEAEVTEHPKTHPAPREKDTGIASPSSPTEPMADRLQSYKKSSSVSSAPSGYSSLPDDDYDDSDVASSVFLPDEEGKPKEK